MDKIQEKLRWLSDQPWIVNFFHIQVMDTIHLLGWAENKLISDFSNSGVDFNWNADMKCLRGNYLADIHNNPSEKVKIIFTLSIR